MILYQRKEKESPNNLEFTDINEPPKYIHQNITSENIEK